MPALTRFGDDCRVMHTQSVQLLLAVSSVKAMKFRLTWFPFHCLPAYLLPCLARHFIDWECNGNWSELCWRVVVLLLYSTTFTIPSLRWTPPSIMNCQLHNSSEMKLFHALLLSTFSHIKQSTAVVSCRPIRFDLNVLIKFCRHFLLMDEVPWNGTSSDA